MEALLHYVWKHKLYGTTEFFTHQGIPFEIIDVGIHNHDAGPDFFNAKIKMNGQLWVGNIEIHLRSSDWYQHKHEQNPAYNSVILHVVGDLDKNEVCDKTGRVIPQWSMQIPDSITQNYRVLAEKEEESVPCLRKLNQIPSIYLDDWKSALLSERLERKTNAILQLLKDYQYNWNEVFYISLARNFGFGINNDAFERLAKSLPLKCILKHQDMELQVEALFLGQAGLLENDDVDDAYYQILKKEYAFLRKKYKLHPLESHVFKNLRIRPNNFPHIKIVQLAGFIRKNQHLFSQILNLTQIKEYQELFSSDVGIYWKTHYHFGKTSEEKSKKLGLSAIHLLLINTVVPLLFAYGKHKNQDIYQERALNLLEVLPVESNFIVTLFRRSGMKIENAADSQSFIQLKREYCEKKKCIFCRIGYKLLIKQSNN